MTLPNVSVTDGLRNTSALASARARSSPVSWPVKIASGSRSSNQARAGPSPITSTLMLAPRARSSASIASANTSRPFSMHQPAEEGDDHLVVGDAVRRAAMPCRAARD